MKSKDIYSRHRLLFFYTKITTEKARKFAEPSLTTPKVPTPISFLMHTHKHTTPRTHMSGAEGAVPSDVLTPWGFRRAAEARHTT